MQYIWKLFKWNGTNDRTELTDYLTAPVFLELRCNEQLATGQVNLENVPINQYLKPFLPKTKFTLERWVSGQLDKYYDYCVDRDEVEHYAGYPEMCAHRIHLIEPSVFAQGLNCDNFALTYELNDVTLNYKTIISSDEKAIPTSGEIVGRGFERPNWSYGGGQYLPSGTGWYNNTGNYTEKYTNSFIYRWVGLDALNGFNRNLNGLVAHNISFIMPIIKCWANNGSAVATELFDCPTRCKVYRTTLRNGISVSGTRTLIKSQLYNPINVKSPTNIGNNGDGRLFYNSGGIAGLRTTQSVDRSVWVPRDSSLGRASKLFLETEIINFPAMINTYNTSNSSREFLINTTALLQSDFDNGLSYQYSVELVIEPYQSGAFIQQHTVQCTTSWIPSEWWQIFTNHRMEWAFSSSLTAPSINSMSASVPFLCRNMQEPAPSNPFLLKGRKYNCFDLFRRAMLTCDTQIFDNTKIGLDEMYDGENNDIGIQYPIEVSSEWMQRMKEAVMFESVFESKNLWEVLQQIGHYLHAIPYLEFARNGKDRFLLKFKQLGGTTIKNNSSNKITIFNSLTLDNYFTQYDSYVANLFSPQNEIDEWVVCKTSDNSFLVSNNTAEIHTKYNITEMIQFDIIYNGETKSALEFVFEKSIYDVLTSKTNMLPAKWSALYFGMGTSKILGLNYVPPAVNSGDEYMALKTIVAKLFTNEVRDKNLKFNNLRFHVRYKTQDSLRITQLRPDLEKFVKNSQYEKYPHNEQFFNPQDKIVDSERFSANLWGRLIRVANGVYQMQEYTAYGQEKEPGDLVQLSDGNYYVTECENECYTDAIFQKVTYSKNFNQLSNIVTIPSEPRFFEISERSQIRREVRLLDFIKLSTLPNVLAPSPRFINPTKWHQFICNLLFAYNGNPQLPNFAYTNYKGDELRRHYNLENNDISILFPKSEAIITNDNTVEPLPSKPNTAVIVPLLHFPLRNAIVFEWDMDDNFKSGDCSDTTTSGSGSSADEAYLTLQPVRYCDVYGRADLFDFKLFYKDDWTVAQQQRLPFAESNDFKPTTEQSTILLQDNLSIGLDKDNREALSFNYQLNLLHEPHDNDVEDFVTFPNLFGEKKGKLKVALLRNAVSMFDEAVKINTLTVIADEIGYTFTNLTNGVRIDFELPIGVVLDEAKSIVFYDTDGTEKYAYIAKNIALLPNAVKLQSWWIYHVFN